MEKKSNNNFHGLGFGSVLCLIFITLKLVGIINWSWVWVLSPIWIILGLVIAILLIVVIIAVIQGMIEKRKNSIKIKKILG